jgi:hypothetical protein
MESGDAKSPPSKDPFDALSIDTSGDKNPRGDKVDASSAGHARAEPHIMDEDDIARVVERVVSRVVREAVLPVVQRAILKVDAVDGRVKQMQLALEDITSAQKQVAEELLLVKGLLEDRAGARLDDGEGTGTTPVDGGKSIAGGIAGGIGEVLREVLGSRRVRERRRVVVRKQRVDCRPDLWT